MGSELLRELVAERSPGEPGSFDLGAKCLPVGDAVFAHDELDLLVYFLGAHVHLEALQFLVDEGSHDQAVEDLHFGLVGAARCAGGDAATVDVVGAEIVDLRQHDDLFVDDGSDAINHGTLGDRAEEQGQREKSDLIPIHGATPAQEELRLPRHRSP